LTKIVLFQLHQFRAISRVSLARRFFSGAPAKPTVSIAQLTAGDKKNFPTPGDMVEVHYVGTLASNGSFLSFDFAAIFRVSLFYQFFGNVCSGKLFDSSRNRGEPFRFRIGDGMVIPGWEISLTQMSLGEKSNVKIPSKLAYDTQEIPGVIPANSELMFEIELLNIYRPLRPVVFEEHVHGPGCGHSH
jgi:FKBP-type peptidyl-prolyl cis-trans isomerase